MTGNMLRRTFLASTVAAFAARLRAAAPGIRLGYDTYSLRAWGWKAMRHLEFCAEQKLDTIQISSLNDFESLEPEHLARVRRRAEELGITIDAGTGCICPSAKAWRPALGDPAEHVRKALRVAHAVGAKSVRCYLGDLVDRLGPTPIEQHIENTVRVFKGARAVALETGVKIALENHSGDLQAWEARMLIEEAGKDYVGACLDTGNPIWCAEHPEVAMEVLAPVTVTTHIRDTALFEHPRGCAAQWTAVGDGVIDFARIVALHRELCPQASMQLEIITGRPPRIVPFLEDEFWKAFPKARASELARFVQLVKNGRPLMKPMIIADLPGERPAEYTAALKAQQKLDLERSLDYCRKSLDTGIRWRS
jgi:3-oxoisoapionate decarboxylase